MAPPAKIRRAEVAADGILILLACAVAATVQEVRGLTNVVSDVFVMFLPNFSWWWEEWRLPGGWNPWIFAGYPSNADPLLGVTHPLGVLYALLPPRTASLAESVVAPAIGGLGMAVYVRSAGGERLGALLAGLVFALGGWATGHLVHPEKLRTTLALPWALAAIEALRGRALVAGLGASLALVVAGGHPQTVLLTLALIGAYVLAFGSWRRPADVLCLVAAAALGAALSAPVWLPASTLVLESTRSLGLEATGAGSPRVAPLDLWGLLTPITPRGEVGFGRCGPVECSVYDGAALWIAVAAALPAVLRSAHGRFWLGAAVLGLVLSTGPLEGLFLAVGIRGPSRFLLWFHAGAAALLGITFRAGLPAAAPLAVAGGVALLLAALRPVLAWPALFVGTVLLALALALWAARRRPRAAQVAVVVVIATDLVVFRTLQPLPADEVERAWRAPLRAVAEAHRALLGPDAHGRVLQVPLAPTPNWAFAEGVPLVQGYNTLVWRPFDALLDSRGGSPLSEQGLVADPALAGASHALDILRARLVVVNASALDPLSAAIRRDAGSRFTPRATANGFEILENERALPVAWLVPSVEEVDDEEARARIHGIPGAKAFDPRATALLAPGSLPSSCRLGDDAGETRGDVAVETYEADRVVLRVDAPRDGFLVTSDLAYPGWTASIDGRPADLVRTNTAFRGLCVPAGAHVVVLAYRPIAARVALALLGLGGVVLAGLLVSGRRPPTRAPSGRPTGS